jgi:hypothetical protein
MLDRRVLTTEPRERASADSSAQYGSILIISGRLGIGTGLGGLVGTIQYGRGASYLSSLHNALSHATSGVTRTICVLRKCFPPGAWPG